MPADAKAIARTVDPTIETVEDALFATIREFQTAAWHLARSGLTLAFACRRDPALLERPELTGLQLLLELSSSHENGAADRIHAALLEAVKHKPLPEDAAAFNAILQKKFGGQAPHPHTKPSIASHDPVMDDPLVSYDLPPLI